MKTALHVSLRNQSAFEVRDIDNIVYVSVTVLKLDIIEVMVSAMNMEKQ